MNQPHIIRIRGPWQRTVLVASAGLEELPETATVKMPSSWVDDLGPAFEGTIRYQRHFNKPTGIDDSTPIQIAFDKLVGTAVIQLNGKPLGRLAWPETAHAYDVRGKLEPRNLIDVELTTLTEQELANTSQEPPPQRGLVGEVRLKIG